MNLDDQYKKSWLRSPTIYLHLLMLLILSSQLYYSDSVLDGERENVVSYIGGIYNATKMFRADADRWPESVSELEEYGYLQPWKRVSNKWIFTIDDSHNIIATSTDLMPGGSGMTIVYNTCEHTVTDWRHYGFQSVVW